MMSDLARTTAQILAHSTVGRNQIAGTNETEADDEARNQYEKANRNHRRKASVAFVLIIAVNSSFAQDRLSPSNDRDNPTPLTSTEIKSDGVDEKTEYFYSFTAGPGEIKLTLDVKAEKSAAVSSVDIALFDA